MKIKMTKAEATRWINAINKLIKERYTRQLKEWEEDSYINCTFCPIVKVKRIECDRCIWVLFTGKDCGKDETPFLQKENAIMNVDRLKGWRKKLYGIRERAVK